MSDLREQFERAHDQMHDEWRDDYKRSVRGELRACAYNVRLCLLNHPMTKGVLGYDEFASRPVLLKRPPWEIGDGGPYPRAIEDTDLTAAAVWLQGVEEIMVSPDRVAAPLLLVARENRFHPVSNYLHGLTWDGVARIDTWLHRYCHAATTDYHAAVGARWLIGAVARIEQPGCKLDTCLVLEGGQGWGKSTAARLLAGIWFTDHLPDLSSKDALTQLQGVWLIEIAEFHAISRAETARIKSFMSSTTDRFRPPYGRSAADHPRQCAFFGTINPTAGGYLEDPTGARRFWVVECGGPIDLDGLRRDRDQLWAEALHRYRAGERWFLDTPALQAAQAEEAEDRYAGDDREDMLLNYLYRLYREEGANASITTAGLVMCALAVTSPERVTRSLQTMAGNVLTRQGWTRRRTSPREGPRERRYSPPPGWNPK
jgi:predicted P-loop ATPase